MRVFIITVLLLLRYCLNVPWINQMDSQLHTYSINCIQQNLQTMHFDLLRTVFLRKNLLDAFITQAHISSDCTVNRQGIK